MNHPHETIGDIADQLRQKHDEAVSYHTDIAEIHKNNSDPLYEPLLENFTRASEMIVNISKGVLGVVEDLKVSTLHPAR